MSTEYENLAGTKLCAGEHSSVIDLYVNQDGAYTYLATDLNAQQLCHLAEELIKIASYISEDSTKLLNLYNVDYYSPKKVS